MSKKIKQPFKELPKEQIKPGTSKEAGKPREYIGPGTMRVSAHYVAEKNKGADKQPDTAAIYNGNITIDKNDMIIQGIQLETEEDKLMNTVLTLLHQKSDVRIDKKNIPANSETFYMGNIIDGKKGYYGEDILPLVRLKLKPPELYKTYTGNPNYSTAEIESIWRIVFRLMKKRFYISYTSSRYIKEGKNIRTAKSKHESFRPLIEMERFYDDVSDEELREINRKPFINDKGEIIVNLHPVCTHQIDTNFIVYPRDINRITEIACGGPKKLTKAIIILRDKLLMKLSKKDYIYLVDENNLPKKLAMHMELKQGRKKRIKEKIQECFDAVKNMGLATEIIRCKGAQNQPQIKIIINPDFNKFR